ncbi:MAG: hypothetical protein HKM93_14575 [Desulfobacteraceae bacterium]|nr:hypothetical protein [Desulfobacteraceae bacterium]
MRKLVWLIIILLPLAAVVSLSVPPNSSGQENSERFDSELMDNLKEKIDTFDIKRPEDRVYLMFDKPFYYPGETIWFQAFVRNASSMKASEMSEILHVELISPKGTTEKELKLIVRDGTVSGDFSLDPDISGGLYKAKAYTNWQKNATDPAFFEKELPVQRVVLPTLKMKLDYLKKTYGKGDRVTATLALETLDNKPLIETGFTYIVSINGEILIEKKGATDDRGTGMIRFKLPDTLSTPDGILNIVIPYQGKKESISRSIPILLNHLRVDLFPEGGDLVAGFESRVAFKAIDEFGLPVDFSGVLKDDTGKTITDFQSFHNGMGDFKFTPVSDTDYFVEVTSPAGIDKKFHLPEVMPRGYTLAAWTGDDGNMEVNVNSTEAEVLSLMVKSRSNLKDAFSFTAKKGENRFTINSNAYPMGVAIITLFDSKHIERAERLVFMNKNKTMDVEITTDKEKYLPREKVTMDIRVTDERGMPLPAQLSLSVTDDKLISFADDKSGTILSQLLLEPDLSSEIHEPKLYFDRNDPKSGRAMDYLMLTHGWRRFTWKEVLNIDNYTPEHASEKAEIKGVVYKTSNGNEPVGNAVVTVKSTGKTYITDNAGKFVIRDVDLFETEILTASSGRKKSAEVYVNQYGDITIYLENHLRYRTLNKDGVIVENALPPAAMAMAGAAMPEIKDDGAGIAFKDLKADQALEGEVLDDRVRPQKKAELAPGMAEKKALIEQPVYYRARVFPAPVYKQTQTDIRTDSRSTIFFKGDIVTDRRGKASLEFYNSDDITAFRSTVEGIGVDGLVGRTEKRHYTQLPFSIDAKLPVEVTMGDRLELPLTIVNNSDRDLKGTLNVRLPEAFRTEGGNSLAIEVGKNGAKTVFISATVLNVPGTGSFTAEFTSGIDKDAFVREVNVASKGFPVKTGLSSREIEKEFTVNIAKPVEGSVRATFTAYPSVLSDMLKGIESILREPHGCFEQTSSSTYPNIMILNYLRENDYTDVSVMNKANDLIKKGYKKLTSFETEQKGYEWFGAAPGHEALTAYGLMEFSDMKRVFQGVDDEMIKRTGNWLLGKRDGRGGFTRNPQALDTFGRASEDITNAYIVYALSEAGFKVEIQKELEWAYAAADKSDDPYQLALVTNALYNVGDDRAESLLRKLYLHQLKDGGFTGKTQSVTSSTGMALKIETTSLTVLAALKSDKKETNIIENGVKFIVESRSPHGGFGNTQSTILALKALIEYTKFSRRTDEAGTVEIYVNRKKVAGTSYTAGEKNEIVIPEETLSPRFGEGEYKVAIKFIGVKKALPYTFALTYNTYLPRSSEKCDVQINTSLNKNTITMGDTVRFKTAVKNNKETDGLPMTTAIVGIPGGLSAQSWQLKELMENKTIDFYETLGSNVIFYLRQMKPGEAKEINLDLKADIPGTYEASASSAYLYYTNELKSWYGGERITIKK